jgi:hypothetical protein
MNLQATSNQAFKTSYIVGLKGFHKGALRLFCHSRELGDVSQVDSFQRASRIR